MSKISLTLLLKYELEGINLLNKRPLIIGMGFDYQIVNEEFGMSYDVKYDIVITENRVLTFS